MRILNGVLCVILILFAAVQYNDPDVLLWAGIYGIAAFWSGVAAFRPQYLKRPRPRGLWAGCALAGLAGMIFYWPHTSHWWVQEVWWNTETAREGMGMMIVAGALLLVGLQMMLVRRPA